MIKDKRGIELGVNFLVVLIISIVVFLGAIMLLMQLLDLSFDSLDSLDEQMEKEILKVLHSGELVSIPYNKEVVSVGSEVYFGVGIKNELRRETMFNVQVSFDSAFYENDSQILADKVYMDENWVFFFKDGHNVSLVRNEPRVVEVKVTADSNIAPDKSTTKGVYIFDVNVTYFDASGVQKIYKDEIYKLYLNVI